MRGSGQRLPITLRFTRVLGTFSHTTCFPFSCALWACFSDRSVSGERSEPIGALMPHAAIPFRPHHRFAVPLPRSRRGCLVTLRFLAESRNISFPRRCGGSGERSEPIGALMPHAALWVVQLLLNVLPFRSQTFQCRTRLCGWCNKVSSGQSLITALFQCRTRLCGWCSLDSSGEAVWNDDVSMPHAALWVVQRHSSVRSRLLWRSFNAARGYSLSPPPPLRGPPPPLTQGRLFIYGTSASLPDAQDTGCCKVPSQREGTTVF